MVYPKAKQEAGLSCSQWTNGDLFSASFIFCLIDPCGQFTLCHFDISVSGVHRGGLLDCILFILLFSTESFGLSFLSLSMFMSTCLTCSH